MLNKKYSSRFFSYILLLLLGAVTFSSCEIIGDIFEAGVWTGIILIVLVVGLLIYIFSRFRGKG
jgi:hypothetical protein